MVKISLLGPLSFCRVYELQWQSLSYSFLNECYSSRKGLIWRQMSSKIILDGFGVSSVWGAVKYIWGFHFVLTSLKIKTCILLTFFIQDVLRFNNYVCYRPWLPLNNVIWLKSQERQFCIIILTCVAMFSIIAVLSDFHNPFQINSSSASMSFLFWYSTGTWCSCL